MKLRITTILSLAGVLSAGSAAALINNTVLSTTEAHAKSGISIDAAGASTDAGAEAATRIFSSGLTATQVMYQVGNAGLVTLDTAGNVLTVVSATANPGWVVVKSESNGSAAAEVKFQSADDLVEFTAQRLDDGSVAAGVESANSSNDNTTGTTDVSGDTSGQGDVDVEGDDNSGHGSVDGCADSNVVTVCVDGQVEVDDD